MFHTDLLTARPHEPRRPPPTLLDILSPSQLRGAAVALISSLIPFCFITGLSLWQAARRPLARLSVCLSICTQQFALSSLGTQERNKLVYLHGFGSDSGAALNSSDNICCTNNLGARERGKETGENCLIIWRLPRAAGGGPLLWLTCQVNKLRVARQTGNGSK